MGQVSFNEDVEERRAVAEPRLRLRQFISVLDGEIGQQNFPSSVTGVNLNASESIELSSMIDALSAPQRAFLSGMDKAFRKQNEYAYLVFDIISLLAPKIRAMHNGAEKRKWQRAMKRLEQSSVFKIKKRPSHSSS